MNIEILDKGNTKFKLTVTPERVSIKIKSGATEEEKQKFIRILTEVANRIYKIGIESSYRGDCGNKMITLKNSSRTQYLTFKWGWGETGEEVYGPIK